MKKIYLFIILGLFLITNLGLIFAEEIDACDSDNLSLCLNETTCDSAEGWWYNNICNAEAEQTSCTENEDCEENYECKAGICILKESETDKVCCKRTRSKQGETSSYNYIYKESCINSNAVDVEIVDDDLCAQKKEQIREAIQEKNRIKFEQRTGQECTEGCTCNGVVMKCQLEGGGREMTVYSRSGNIIIQVKNTNVSTTIEIYNHNGTLYGKFKDGEKPIKTPDQIQEKIRQRIKQKTCECDEMNLTDDGLYQVQTKKKAKLFWIFPIREKARVQLDAASGEIYKFRNPWWGFLANDVEEEELVGESCGTVTPGYNDECCVNKGYNSWNEETFECE